jgi:general secretion pathway protein J
MRRRPDAGFTLVELMVALGLFALVSLASLALLRSSIDTQTALAGRMDRVAGLERARALMADGLLTAQPQVQRSGGQAATPSFTGRPDRLSFASIAPGPDGTPRQTQLTVRRSGDQLLLQRTDGETGAILLDNLVSARFRFRDATGAWQDSWTPERAHALPRAAELSIQQRGGPEVLMRFPVAPAWPAPADIPA